LESEIKTMAFIIDHASLSRIYIKTNVYVTLVFTPLTFLAQLLK